MNLYQWVKADHGPVFNRMKPATALLAMPIVIVLGAFLTLREERYFSDMASLLGQIGKAVWTGDNGGWE